MATIQRILVANRGEIARRIFRTARELGIQTVAVHSDVDAEAPFVREADFAVALPGTSAAQTYLRGDLVLAAATKSGADAIHPGYGFLAENASFAQSVLDAGLTWIGPSPSSIEAMGSKTRAKALMAAAGVPVLTVPQAPRRRDLPLLVKASAGGGGRGMRIVRDLADLDEALAAAAAEAESAFGDATVFLEPYIEHARHIEVQVLGDGTNVVVLGTRDCSIQRRHQKVIEEAPAPGLSEQTRAALHEAARAAALAVEYRGAGTVEFLVDAAGDRFWFLEMNTRLQVEHPVTEAIYGIDLVAAQIAIAEGQPLPEVGAPHGHCVEARLYAEDPLAGYQPQTGRLTAFEIPGGLRVDAGVEAGDEISPFYDAMIAKVIAWAPTRDAALRKLAGALRRARIHGLTTNRDLLVELLDSQTLRNGQMHTGYLDGLELAPGSVPLEHSAFAAAVALALQRQATAAVQRRVPAGWRNVVSQPQVTTFLHRGSELSVRWYGGHEFRSPDVAATVVTATPSTVVLEIDGVRTRFSVTHHGDRVEVDSPLGHVALIRKPRFTEPSPAHASGSLLAPMPGSVVSVAAKVGDPVAPGQPILVLEAMKMQHTLHAPHAGVVTHLAVLPGSQVAAGDVLAVVEEQP